MRDFLAALTRSRISLAGSAIATASAVVFFTLLALDLVRPPAGPYLGILTYLIIPLVFVFGLLLIPPGVWLARRRDRRAGFAGGRTPIFPVIDFNRQRTRALAMTLLALTSANVVLLATATYKGIEVLDSTRFCGRACHDVMEPEYRTYQRSAHASVSCVSCHVGSGGGSFVRAKLNGVGQVVAVALDNYPRPVPAPVENLRPAHETCGDCHHSGRFMGDALKS